MVYVLCLIGQDKRHESLDDRCRCRRKIEVQAQRDNTPTIVGGPGRGQRPRPAGLYRAAEGAARPSRQMASRPIRVTIPPAVPAAPARRNRHRVARRQGTMTSLGSQRAEPCLSSIEAKLAQSVCGDTGTSSATPPEIPVRHPRVEQCLMAPTSWRCRCALCGASRRAPALCLLRPQHPIRLAYYSASRHRSSSIARETTPANERATVRQSSP